MFTLASWIGVFLCVPETRRERSKDELGECHPNINKDRYSLTFLFFTIAGQPVYTLRSGEVRPRLDSGTYGPRTLRSNFGVLNVPIRWDLGKTTLFQTLKCILFPTVAWATLLTGVLSGAGTAMAQTTSVALLLMGWDLRLLGMAGLAMLCATPFTWLIAGWAADKVCNLIARARNGRREPEMHLVNIIFPTICAVLGIVIYGYIGDHIRTIPRPDYALLAMVSLHTLGSACINTTFQVFLLESFPSHAR
jgi:MFS family permease